MKLLLLLVVFAGCIDAPPGETEPVARISLAWEPTDCGPPHRVVVELEDERGTRLSKSAPCALGGMTVDAEIYGFHLGRLYAWEAGAPIRSEQPLRLEVDAPVVRWFVPTPQ